MINHLNIGGLNFGKACEIALLRNQSDILLYFCPLVDIKGHIHISFRDCHGKFHCFRRLPVEFICYESLKAATVLS